ncbi:TrbC/VirB2 family protein, partial [Novosphingobium sp. PhB165]|uniref:TrbC/VirB2 family protein n=1 Tax=Novosphingobium sp. PhB165 TaxID=2485105 RepID=UPI001404C2AA
WLASLLTGSIALTIGGLAIAVIGVLMLEGRFPFRRGMITILGCFLLFGATYIAHSLIHVAQPQPIAATVFVAPLNLQPVETNSPPANFDPYAGASVPVH